MASIFQIGISRNTKRALKDSFHKSSHIYIVLCVGGSKQKECFIYHKVASVLYEK